MSYRGLFKPRNPSKYKGNPNNIIYRSSWELKLMRHLDIHPDVLFWASEELVIPYRSPIDNKIHRYYPDFYVKKRNSQGVVETLLIEVKPKKQSVPPTPQSKPTKRYLNEVMTYGINMAKWKAAKEYCEDRKWKFLVMTETELGIK
jgi:hypothetical protein